MKALLTNGFVEVHKYGRFLFKYDPERQLIRIKPKGADEPYLVDLPDCWPVEKSKSRSETQGKAV
jgi:hypothetical protein